MNARLRGAILTVICFAGVSSVIAQTDPALDILGRQLILDIKVSTQTNTEHRYTITLRNNGTKTIYYCANPQQADGTYGTYVLLDKEKKSAVLIESRVFDRQIIESINIYSNETRVELKKLEPGKTTSESLTLK